MTYDEFVVETDVIAGQFVDSLHGTEQPGVIIGAAFKLIDIVLQHMPPQNWDEAEKHVKDCTASVIRNMRGGKSEGALQ